MHKHAILASQYAECSATQGKFWPFHDIIIVRQPQWSKLADAKPAFDIMVNDADVDKAQLDQCLDDGI